MTCKGWCDEGKLSLLFDLAAKTRGIAGDVLEIGSAWGRSTVVLCKASRKTVWSIDPHTGGIGVLRKGETQDSYAEFIANLRRCGVASHTRVLKHTTTEVVEQGIIPQAVRFSLVFIDGMHTAEAVRTDFSFACSRLTPGGVVVFDDYYEKSVSDYREAIDELIRDNSLTLIESRSVNLVHFVKDPA
jgi:predicted O-methyltransferase YrrM